jgi:hypothetical protein
MISISESNHGDDSALTDASPRQSQHQGVELRVTQTDAVSGASSRPNEVPLVQSSGGQPDTNSVMYQYFHAVGASVGKEIGGVRMGSAKDLNDSGQGGVGACTHVQGSRCKPYGVYPDLANHSRSHYSQEAPPCRGQLTMMVVLARCTSMRMSVDVGSSGCGVANVGCAVNVTGINASC